jgi:hypothetical protein
MVCVTGDNVPEGRLSVGWRVPILSSFWCRSASSPVDAGDHAVAMCSRLLAAQSAADAGECDRVMAEEAGVEPG